MFINWQCPKKITKKAFKKNSHELNFPSRKQPRDRRERDKVNVGWKGNEGGYKRK